MHIGFDVIVCVCLCLCEKSTTLAYTHSRNNMENNVCGAATLPHGISHVCLMCAFAISLSNSNMITIPERGLFACGCVRACEYMCVVCCAFSSCMLSQMHERRVLC